MEFKIMVIPDLIYFFLFSHVLYRHINGILDQMLPHIRLFAIAMAIAECIISNNKQDPQLTQNRDQGIFHSKTGTEESKLDQLNTKTI